jgi:DNA-binding CsgD family transcriptional regulator
VITSFKKLNREAVLDKPAPELTRLVLSRKDYLFSLEFAALDYAIPLKNRYAFKMEGIDPDWVPATATQRNATYTNLSPGRYTFRVKGSNNDDVWNETGVTVSIVIAPAFWQTWWFKAFWIALLFSLFLIWHKTRMKRLAEQIKTEAAMKEFCLKFNISEREREIIQWILKGKSNKEIEEELYIALGTVKNHVYNIYQKLNVESRSQLINLFKNLKIL